jgi:hypothetical protein
MSAKTYRLMRGGKWLSEFDYSGNDTNAPIEGTLHAIADKFWWVRNCIFTLYERRGDRFVRTDDYTLWKFRIMLDGVSIKSRG